MLREFRQVFAAELVGFLFIATDDAFPEQMTSEALHERYVASREILNVWQSNRSWHLHSSHSSACRLSIHRRNHAMSEVGGLLGNRLLGFGRVLLFEIFFVRIDAVELAEQLRSQSRRHFIDRRGNR